ncbi:hypothetical protein DSO57_1012074 [Entomophthora muscae]|uniref:Uncharacterized protein n=1 Tax=Entomophthora muscae TaxID=34485 RepID=A0ACC2TTL1_9FUNG|nr:hypothetical protein DSO57_1012074 [Entomophthora muscae]
MNDDYKPVVPGSSKDPLEADTLKIEKLNKGISIEKLFEDTLITISLADLFQESPTSQQKAHKAVLALQPHRKEESFLAGTGAPRTEGAVNGRMTHAILDGGAYSNLITAKFLESLTDITIAPSDVTFIMSDESKKFCLSMVKGLKLWIGGTEIEIDASIFNHHKYTLLMRIQKMTELGIITQCSGNNWTIEYNNLKTQLYITFDTPQITKFLCESIESNISKNKWLSNDKKSQLVEFIEPYVSNIVGDSNNLPEASGFKHKIDTGDAFPITSRFYHLLQSKEEFVKKEINRLLKKGLIKPSS